MSIANHELGVVVRLTEEDIEAEGSLLATWKRPLEKYGPKDTPWVRTCIIRGYSEAVLFTDLAIYVCRISTPIVEAECNGKLR